MTVKTFLRKIPFYFLAYKIFLNCRRCCFGIINFLIYTKQYAEFKKREVSAHRFECTWRDRYPCLGDATVATVFDTHYVYHTGWAARILRQINPDRHIDIGSSLYFISIVSAHTAIDFYDYRPANIVLKNIYSHAANICSLPFEDASVPSLSCMHVVEHIGLGRYGDPIDTEGDIKAINEIKRVMRREGDLLFVVPVGKPRIIFNAHRIYSFDQIIEYFSGFKLEECTLIPDNALEVGIIKNPTKEKVNQQQYGCGCFWFKNN